MLKTPSRPSRGGQKHLLWEPLEQQAALDATVWALPHPAGPSSGQTLVIICLRTWPRLVWDLLRGQGHLRVPNTHWQGLARSKYSVNIY